MEIQPKNRWALLIGEALRHARRTTRDRYPEGATWASYVLYGDPTYRLPHSD